MKKENRGILLMLSCACLWSIAGVMMKFIPWNPMVIAALRALFAGITVYIYIRLRSLPVLINKKTVRTGASMCLTCTLFSVANKLTTAANAIVLQFTAPVFILLISAVLYRRRFSRLDITAVLVTLGGIALFFLDQLTPGRLAGNCVGVLCGLCMGFMYVFMGEVTISERFSSVLLAEIFTTLIGLPFLFLTHPEFSPRPVLFIIILGVFQLGIPYVLYSFAAETCPPLACCLLGALEPLLNPVWVMLFYGEVPGIFALIGGVTVIGAVTAWSILSARQTAETGG